MSQASWRPTLSCFAAPFLRQECGQAAGKKFGPADALAFGIGIGLVQQVWRDLGAFRERPPLTFGSRTLTFCGMTDSISPALRPGTRVKITQQIAARHYSWNTDVIGTVVSFEQKQTGSWYAHSRGDKLWLDRLKIRKADGELTTLNLDEFTHIEIVDDKGKPIVHDD